MNGGDVFAVVAFNFLSAGGEMLWAFGIVSSPEELRHHIENREREEDVGAFKVFDHNQNCVATFTYDDYRSPNKSGVWS